MGAYIGNMSDNIWHYLFFNDILMIISGLIGSTVGGGDKWVFFGFSILCYLPVIYYCASARTAPSTTASSMSLATPTWTLAPPAHPTAAHSSPTSGSSSATTTSCASPSPRGPCTPSSGSSLKAPAPSPPTARLSSTPS